ncbi:uncharacterized protein LOC129312027 [Prosopis cineraria]|uniref:uncharacterized protein LOC129312027 n=1 Tax=Prosopis cineraria TaxID=364024 RepID=UPI00240E9D01|nr:uncharacterized protein LOC129312027 [Prosopis cineraria]
MGNYVSCNLRTPLMKNTRAARVIFPTGEVKQYKQTAKAAELMLECPGYFITNSGSLHIGRRFSALGADEELESGGVYILFPMRRLNSMVTAADMAVFFMAANSAAKRIKGGKVGVMPDKTRESSVTAPAEESEAAENGGENGGPRLSLEGVETGFHYRLSYCRSRKPVLETISEEPIYLR